MPALHGSNNLLKCSCGRSHITGGIIRRSIRSTNSENSMSQDTAINLSLPKLSDGIGTRPCPIYGEHTTEKTDITVGT